MLLTVNYTPITKGSTAVVDYGDLDVDSDDEDVNKFLLWVWVIQIMLKVAMNTTYNCLTQTNLIQFHVDMGNAAPIYRRPYPHMSHSGLEQLHEEIKNQKHGEQWHSDGIIINFDKTGTISETDCQLTETAVDFILLFIIWHASQAFDRFSDFPSM
ncbi:predicted protein [Lichtheimia corymbifera JMRC:FSU:9682]|uniref:Uncharacterized protein n=1 Tax=Lichtheimia corymbifera JMRC:FSU:9682 TaxID=1263082 RepID=A0A068SHA1_9FUNG|nr:predicted protein [Lichtheimia corymbifera JMRC:FSU:9682]